jgi:hypothetical protein
MTHKPWLALLSHDVDSLRAFPVPACSRLPVHLPVYNLLHAHAPPVLSQLVDPSYCAADEQQLAAARAEHGNSAEQVMAAVRNMMQMSSSLLADMPSKVEFCRQRIAQVSSRG